MSRIQRVQQPLIRGSLVGRWLCGAKDVNDYSETGNNGSLVGSPTWTDGRRGPMLTLNGSDQSVSIPDHASMEIGASDFTICAWIYLTGYSSSYSGAYGAAILAKDSNISADRSFAFYCFGTASSWTRTAVQLFDTSSNTNNNFTVSLALNTLYLCVARRISGVVYQSVNAGTPGSEANTRTVRNTATTVKIGQLGHTTYQYWFPGKLYDVRLYLRGLSDDEVAAIYRGQG